MQHLKGSGTPVLYIGRTVLKVKKKRYVRTGCSGWNDGAVCGIFYLMLCGITNF